MSKRSSGGVRKIGRDARTGEFIPVKEARQRPSTTTVDRLPPPTKRRK